MRVILINPRSHLPIETRTSPHLGLAYLGAVSLEAGYDTVIWDGDVEEESLSDAVQRIRPDIVGITANTPQVEQAWHTARAIKSIKDVPIVLGGPHGSALPAESCSRKEIDIVVRGEGEAVWTKLCKLVERELGANPGFAAADLLAPDYRALAFLPGISYSTTDGQEHHNPDHHPIANLDALPWPAYQLFKMDRYTNLQPAVDAVDGSKSFSIITSRGCPYRCIFCSQSVMSATWRPRSPENVLAEWRFLVEDLGAQEIGVLDDCANLDSNRLDKLADYLIENNLNRVPWIFVNGIRADLVSAEILSKLKRAGLKRTAFGVESGDPDVLRSIGKRMDHDTIRRAFADAKRVGLETIGFFIIGLPGETEASMEKTIQFACELDPLVANFLMMTPYPGTKAYEMVRDQGRFLIEDWRDYAFYDNQARYEMGELTAELVERKWKEAYRRFYLRPHRIAKTLTRRYFWLNWRRTFKMAWKTVF